MTSTFECTICCEEVASSLKFDCFNCSAAVCKICVKRTHPDGETIKCSACGHAYALADLILAKLVTKNFLIKTVTNVERARMLETRKLNIDYLLRADLDLLCDRIVRGEKFKQIPNLEDMLVASGYDRDKRRRTILRVGVGSLNQDSVPINERRMLYCNASYGKISDIRRVADVLEARAESKSPLPPNLRTFVYEIGDLFVEHALGDSDDSDDDDDHFLQSDSQLPATGSYLEFSPILCYVKELDSYIVIISKHLYEGYQYKDAFISHAKSPVCGYPSIEYEILEPYRTERAVVGAADPSCRLGVPESLFSYISDSLVIRISTFQLMRLMVLQDWEYKCGKIPYTAGIRQCELNIPGPREAPASKGPEDIFEQGRVIPDRACPRVGCEGVVSQSRCNKCFKWCCARCGMSQDENHVCDPSDIAAQKEIALNSRPCPRCSIPIYKISGCDQMFCTICKTIFSWETMKIVCGGFVHNPHALDYLRGEREKKRRQNHGSDSDSDSDDDYPTDQRPRVVTCFEDNAQIMVVATEDTLGMERVAYYRELEALAKKSTKRRKGTAAARSSNDKVLEDPDDMNGKAIERLMQRAYMETCSSIWNGVCIPKITGILEDCFIKVGYLCIRSDFAGDNLTLLLPDQRRVAFDVMQACRRAKDYTSPEIDAFIAKFEETIQRVKEETGEGLSKRETIGRRTSSKKSLQNEQLKVAVNFVAALFEEAKSAIMKCVIEHVSYFVEYGSIGEDYFLLLKRVCRTIITLLTRRNFWFHGEFLHTAHVSFFKPGKDEAVLEQMLSSMTVNKLLGSWCGACNEFYARGTCTHKHKQSGKHLKNVNRRLDELQIDPLPRKSSRSGSPTAVSCE